MVMAADLVVYALPNTPGSWHTTRVMRGEVELPGDEFMYDDDGKVLAWCSGDVRDRFEDEFHRADHDFIEVGPYSSLKASTFGDDRWLPGPTIAIGTIFHVGARVITKELIAEIMVCRNLPDHSYYGRTWVKGFRGARTTVLKRWLRDRMGMIVWSSAW